MLDRPQMFASNPESLCFQAIVLLEVEFGEDAAKHVSDRGRAILGRFTSQWWFANLSVEECADVLKKIINEDYYKT